jgi:S1-C subfamily serine protease
VRKPFPVLLSSLLVAAASTLASPSHADVPRLATTDAQAQRALGFSNLVLRVESAAEIGVAPAEFRVMILEALRQAGFNAVGAESLVFGKDSSKRADLLLGGTIREFECLNKYDRSSCRIGIEWQVLDVVSDAIVYTVLSRSAELDVPSGNSKAMVKNLVLGALKSLMKRPKFRDTMRPTTTKSEMVSPNYSKARVTRCPAAKMEMPSAAEDALRATVLVKSGDGFGSGFLLSPDGLVLTAAHVLGSSDITVRMRDGSVRQARALRVARNVDSALLQIVNAGVTPCLSLDVEPKRVGAEVYAIGSPASQKLAFSLTRGIISALRDLDGSQFLQTDASINPGNSGGPLIDSHGRVTAIVSWKVAGSSVEGIAFGVPIESSMRELALEPSTGTDASLSQTAPVDLSAVQRKPSAEPDTFDAMPSIDPEADYRWAVAQQERQWADYERDREERLRKMTPFYVPLLRWGGLLVASAGAIAIIHSYTQFDDRTTTQFQFQDLRTENDLGWAGVAVGATAFVSSYLLAPKLPPDPSAPKRPGATVSLACTPRAVRLDVGF